MIVQNKVEKTILLFDSFGKPLKFNSSVSKKELWRMFLCKFPTFDPSWSEEVISKWLEEFFLLWQWRKEIKEE